MSYIFRISRKIIDTRPILPHIHPLVVMSVPNNPELERFNQPISTNSGSKAGYNANTLEDGTSQTCPSSVTTQSDSSGLTATDKEDDLTADKLEDLCLQEQSKKPRKLVGFAPEPEEELKDHHRYLEQKRKERRKDNPFWKMPDELAYLDRKDQKERAPAGPQLPAIKTSKKLKLKDLPDRPTRAVKEISAVNKSTAINFHYFEIKFPLPANKIMIDVHYSTISSLDLTKLSKYTYNISDEKVGLGYDYVGVISKVSDNLKDSQYQVGATVFGMIKPTLRKGALQTCLVVSASDPLVLVDDDDISSLDLLKVRLDKSASSAFTIDEDDSSSSNAKPEPEPETQPRKLKVPHRESYQIEDVLTTTSKFCTFGSLYCRAKQALVTVDKVIRSNGTANVLINGADTCLGYTLMQVLASSLYSRDLLSLNVVAVVRYKSLEQVEAVISHLGPSSTRRFSIVPYDEVNDDLFFKGEKVPIKYKSMEVFSLEIFQALLAGKGPDYDLVKEDPRLDLFVDVVGSKKMFQESVGVGKTSAADNTSVLKSCFGEQKEALFLKIMKPKASGCAYVSYRDFQTPEPTYLVDTMAYKTFFNPWSTGWTQSFANLLVSRYCYYDVADLECRKEWLVEGLHLVKNEELRVLVNKVTDWRNNFRKDILDLQANDGCIVFKIEAF